MTDNLAYRELPREELIGGRFIAVAPARRWTIRARAECF